MKSPCKRRFLRPATQEHSINKGPSAVNSVESDRIRLLFLRWPEYREPDPRSYTIFEKTELPDVTELRMRNQGAQSTDIRCGF